MINKELIITPPAPPLLPCFPFGWRGFFIYAVCAMTGTAADARRLCCLIVFPFLRDVRDGFGNVSKILL